MNEWARVFTEQIAAGAGGVGIALIAAIIFLALSHITLPALRRLWRRATPFGRIIGALLFLVCSINATTKAPRRVPARSAASVSKSHSERFENWFRRGAWRDVRFVKFDSDWIFPLGTNHLAGVWIHSWGEVAHATMPRETFAALGTSLALFPEETEVTWKRTPSNTYRVAWQNAFPDRRSRENAMDAAIELFRNGDIAIMTNNITRHISRELPFACAGRGQDADWVAANYPNASGDFATWVDSQVGVGLENGLFRFTATFPTVPEEAIELFVGPYTVAVTNTGEYVFLLEKGRDYSFGTRPFVPDVTYAAVDDLGAANKMLLNDSGWYGTGWTTVGGGLNWELPTETTDGNCCWLPYFTGAPDLPYLSPSALPAIFEGVLSDAGENLDVSYEWRTSHDNLEIAAPNERKTEVLPKAGTDSGNYDLSVTATFGQHKLTSTISGYYYTNATEETSLSISAPNVLLLESNAVQGQAEGVVKIDLQLPEGESGSLSLECVSGADKIQLNGEPSWQVSGSTTKEVRIVAQSPSVERGDIKFLARFESCKGNSLEESAVLTVVKVWYRALALIPENTARKCFGVGERMLLQWEPIGIPFNIECDNGSIESIREGLYSVEVAHKAGITTVSLEAEEINLTCRFDIVEPQEVVAELVDWEFSETENLAGGISLYFKVFIKPLDVSFIRVEIQELPRVAEDATGYFTRIGYADFLDHGKNGAGSWNSIRAGNYVTDNAAVVRFQQPWLNGGAFTWPIPLAWRCWGDNESVTNEFAYYTQRFELDANGTTRIKKFGYCAERTTNNVHSITGGSR